MTSQSSYVPSFLLAIAMSLTAAVGAQEAMSASVIDDRIDQFNLFTQCSRMDTVIEIQRSNSTSTQSVPTQDEVRRAVTSRLRSARLFDDVATSPILYVGISIVGAAYNVTVQFYKSLMDSYSGLTLLASSWDIRYTGTHGNHSSYIISDLGQALDLFIDEYLRVNEKDC